jgi:hypothetical protein
LISQKGTRGHKKDEVPEVEKSFQGLENGADEI